MLKVGREEPVASMDSSGKIIWARHNEIQVGIPAGLVAASEAMKARPLAFIRRHQAWRAWAALLCVCGPSWFPNLACSDVQTVNIKALGADYEMVDGERLPVAVKDLGSCDLYPQALQHNPNGRFVVVSGDGEAHAFCLPTSSSNLSCY